MPALPRSKVVRTKWGIYQDVLPDKDQVIDWFQRPGANLAVVCGTGGLIVFDFDDRRDYDRWFIQGGELSHTYTEFTHRGAHVFYLVKDLVIKSCAFQEAELLGRGHLCLVHPSIHPSGAGYVPTVNPGWKIKSLRKVDLEQLTSLLSRRAGGEVYNPAEELNRCSNKYSPDGRNDLIANIKAAFPILDFVRSWTEVMPSGGSGRYYVCHCPFHEDQSPSMWIDSVRGLWGCFSPSCPGGKGGDVINLYALHHGLSIQEAIKRLAGGIR